MKNVIKTMLVILIVFSAHGSLAYGEQVYISNIQATMNSSNVVSVEGNFSSGIGHKITLTVIDPKGGIEYVDETVSLFLGSFKFSFAIKAPIPGKYKLVLAADGLKEKYNEYIDYGNNVDLKELSLSNGKIDKVFSSEIKDYSVKVDYRIKSIRITPIARDLLARVYVNDKQVVNGNLSEAVKLDQGDNLVTIRVEALNKTIGKYTLKITRDNPINTNLTEKVELDGFKQVKIHGQASSGAGQQVIVRVVDPNKELDYLNSTLTDIHGNYFLEYYLKNDIKGKYYVYASMDGTSEPAKTSFDYGVDASLSMLSVGGISLTPEFNSNIMSYSMNVKNRYKSIKVIPTANDALATIRVNGIATLNGQASQPIVISEGSNTIDITITAQDGVTVCKYSVVVNRDSKITANGTIECEVNKVKQVTVDGCISSGAGQQITTVIVDPDGNIEYTGSVLSGDKGNYRITYELKNKLVGIYQVSVGMEGLKVPLKDSFIYDPSNANLKSLVFSGIGAKPTFDKDTIKYSASVDYDTVKFGITPMPVTKYASVTINGSQVDNGKLMDNIPLIVGHNTARVEVTSEDGSVVKEYVIDVFRQPKPELVQAPQADELVSLTLKDFIGDDINNHPLTISSSMAVNVSEDAGYVAIIPTTRDANASIKVNGINVDSGTLSSRIARDEATNNFPSINIVVTKEDGTSKTYLITVTNHPYNTNLKSLKFYNQAGNSSFASLIGRNDGGYTYNSIDDDPFGGYFVGVEGVNIPGSVEMELELYDSEATAAVFLNNSTSPIVRQADGKYSIPIVEGINSNRVRIDIEEYGSISTYNVRLSDLLQPIWIAEGGIQDIRNNNSNNCQIIIDDNITAVQLQVNSYTGHEGEDIKAYYYKSDSSNNITRYEIQSDNFGILTNNIASIETESITLLDGYNIIDIDVTPRNDTKTYHYTLTIIKQH